jgi:hypothetical protein
MKDQRASISLLLAAVFQASCHDLSMENPAPLFPRRMDVHSVDAHETTWAAVLHLSENGELQAISIACDSKPYGEGSRDILPEEVIGARIVTNSDTTCQRGSMQVLVYTAEDLNHASRPEVFHTYMYYFDGGEYLSHTLDH